MPAVPKRKLYDPSEHQYPKWVHPAGKPSQIVQNADEERSVMGVKAEPSSDESVDAAPAIPDRDSLVAEAKALGVEVDNRWGLARLSDEIAKAKG